MNGWLLDTNVPSELVQPRPNSMVRGWFLSQELSSLYLSVITLGELRAGFVFHSQVERRIRLTTWYQERLVPSFAGRILPVSEHVAELWGELSAKGRATGRPLAKLDGLVAATALFHGLGVVTRNVKDFAQTGVRLLNPWEL